MIRIDTFLLLSFQQFYDSYYDSFYDDETIRSKASIAKAR